MLFKCVWISVVEYWSWRRHGRNW